MQKNKSFNLQGMVVVSLLIALSIILSRFSVMIPLFGYPSVRFSVTSIPIFLASALFGPVLGACAGFISDIISFVLSSSGPYHPGFTINAIISGIIPGLVFMKIKKSNKHYSFNTFNILMAVLAFIGATIYINFIGIHELENVGTIMSLPTNLWMTIFMVVMIIIQVGIVYSVQKKAKQTDGYFSIDKIIFISIIQYLVIHLTLTPIWLNQLYGIPVAASVFVRVFKAIIDVPLQVGLTYIVINALPLTLIGGKQCKVQ